MTMLNEQNARIIVLKTFYNCFVLPEYHPQGDRRGKHCNT